jgi:hypothetical protein
VVEIREFEQRRSSEEFHSRGRPASLLEDGLAVVDACARSEGVPLEVSSESNPSGKHDAGVFSAGVEPSESMVGKRVEVSHRV